MNKLLGAVLLSTGTIVAQAHEGHGLPGTSHWHPTDLVGYVVLAVVVAAALWNLRGK